MNEFDPDEIPDDLPEPQEPPPDDEEQSPKTPLEERQELLAHHVRLVARKMSHALFVFGAQGGLGKSRTILRTLDEEGIQPVLINSHVTPLSLYSTLFRHRGEDVLFFDDCDSMYSSMPHLGLLRSALWGNPRVVTYGSTQLPDDLPPSFETTARFVFAANVIPKRNAAFQAVLSRTDQFELSATNEEVIEMMRTLAAKGFQGVSPFDAGLLIDYIAEQSGDRQLSLRLLGPSVRKLRYAREAGIDFRPLVLSQLQSLGRKAEATKRLDNKNKDITALERAIRRHPESVPDQLEAWCRATGKSRASFYRTLNRFKRDRGE